MLRDARITGSASMGGEHITYVDGELGGYVLLEDLFDRLNGAVRTQCECLGLGDRDLMSLTPDGSKLARMLRGLLGIKQNQKVKSGRLGLERQVPDVVIDSLFDSAPVLLDCAEIPAADKTTKLLLQHTQFSTSNSSQNFG